MKTHVCSVSSALDMAESRQARRRFAYTSVWIRLAPRAPSTPMIPLSRDSGQCTSDTGIPQIAGMPTVGYAGSKGRWRFFFSTVK